jgi:hypothetical protein
MPNHKVLRLSGIQRQRDLPRWHLMPDPRIHGLAEPDHAAIDGRVSVDLTRAMDCRSLMILYRALQSIALLVYDQYPTD